MARLIDVDAFLEDHCGKCGYRRCGSCTKDDPICGTIWDLTEYPTVDAVEVVRCKDCKHYMYEEYCGLLYGMDRRNPGDFCSYAERREKQNKHTQKMWRNILSTTA